MKTIYALLTFEADVPDDMDENALGDAVASAVNEKLDRFRARVPDYPNEDEAEPMFDLRDTAVCESFKLEVYHSNPGTGN
jgi:hypothetical protein